MNKSSSESRHGGFILLLVGIIIAITGLILDAFWTEQYWLNKPPYSSGPFLVGTAGLFFIFPLGVLIFGYGLVRQLSIPRRARESPKY